MSGKDMGRFQGTIRRLGPTYGFIEIGRDEDLFFSRDAIVEGKPFVGAIVDFRAIETVHKGLLVDRAVDVKVLGRPECKAE